MYVHVTFTGQKTCFTGGATTATPRTVPTLVAAHRRPGVQAGRCVTIRKRTTFCATKTLTGVYSQKVLLRIVTHRPAYTPCYPCPAHRARGKVQTSARFRLPARAYISAPPEAKGTNKGTVQKGTAPYPLPSVGATERVKAGERALTLWA